MKYKDWFFYLVFGSAILFVSYHIARTLVVFLISSITSKEVQLITLNPIETIQVLFLSTIIISLILLMPYLLYRMYKYVEDALYEREKDISRRSLRWLFLPVFGGAIGLLFTDIIIFPFLLRVMEMYGITAILGLKDVIRIYLINALLMAIIFTLPLCVKVLSSIGFISKSDLRKARRVVYVVSLVVLAIITPTMDGFTLIIMFIPFLVVYEGSIIIIKENKDSKHKKHSSR